MLASLLLSVSLLAAPTGPTGPTGPAAAPAKPGAKAAPAAAKPAPAAAKPAPAPAKPAASANATPAPQAPTVIATKKGKLEFSHKAHASVDCAACHVGQATPARWGLQGKVAAHRLCIDCHKAEKKGPQKCTACHQQV